MSLAETYPQDSETSGLSLAGPETEDSKQHIGPDETARLMVVGTFNARILANKVKLAELSRLPLPPFGNQDTQLAQEIEQLRAERDHTIATRTYGSTEHIVPPRLMVVETVPSQEVEAVEPPEDSLSCKMAKLQELTVAYTSLARQIGSSLENLADTPDTQAFALLDTLFDLTDMVTAAGDHLAEQSNEVTHQLEHAHDQIATPEQDNQETVGPVENDIRPVISPSVHPAEVSPSTFEVLPDYEQRIAELLQKCDQPTSSLVFAITGQPGVNRRHFEIVHSVIGDMVDRGLVTNLPKGMWGKGKQKVEPSATTIAPVSPPPSRDFEKQIAGIRRSNPANPWKPAQRGRFTGSRRRR